jgi:hypothetical protein
MAAAFESIFAALKPLLEKHAKKMSVQTDTPVEFTLVTKSPSPFPQHKGHGLFFSSIRQGKAYVSYHLVPLYMNPALAKNIAPALKRRMQGKACFNFKAQPEPDALAELKRLTQAGFDEWREKKWL